MRRFEEWGRRVFEKEMAMRAESDSPPPLANIADFIWWLELEEMLNQIGITQVLQSDDRGHDE